MIRLIIATAFIAASTVIAKAETLDDLRWKNRIVLLFAEQADDPQLREQTTLLLADRQALAERDLAVFTIAGDRLATAFGPSLGKNETATALRNRFSLGHGSPFTAILIGKDGGVKWRASKATPLAEINAVIDAMPMRRSERN